MSLVDGVRSQVNNVRNFRRLFPTEVLARNLLTFPRDYILPSGFAGPPMVVNLLTTSRCNLRCEMCSVHEFRSRKFVEMSPADLERIVLQVAPYKTSFYLSGGEPFLRADILDLVDVVKRHGLAVGAVSNGLAVTPERGERLKTLGLDSLMFSLHGPEEVHDRITGLPGAFRKATENIAAFCRGPRPTNVILNFVLSRHNMNSMVDLVEVGRRLGVDRVRIEHLLFMTEHDNEMHNAWCRNHVAPEIQKDLRASTFLCQSATVDGFAESLPDLLDDVRKRYGDFVYIKPALGRDEIRDWYTSGYSANRRCVFIWRSLFIDTEGTVIPCQHYMGYRLGNVLREPLMEIWNSPRYRAFRRLIRHQMLPACARCCKL